MKNDFDWVPRFVATGILVALVVLCLGYGLFGNGGALPFLGVHIV